MNIDNDKPENFSGFLLYVRMWWTNPQKKEKIAVFCKLLLTECGKRDIIYSVWKNKSSKGDKMKNNKIKLVLKIVCAVLCAAIVMAGSVCIAAYVMQDDIDAWQAKLDVA